MGQKSCYGAILTLFIGLAVWVCPFFISEVFGATLFEDNFDFYNNNVKLGGQGGWGCTYDYLYVNSDEAQSSPQSVVQSGGVLSSCYKNSVDLTTGEMSFWVKTADISSNEFFVNLERDSTTLMNFQGTHYLGTSLIKIFGAESGTIEIEIPFDFFADWIKIQWRWEIVNYLSFFSYKIGEENWSDWFEMTNPIASGVNRLLIHTTDADRSIFFDTLGEPAPSCSDYETWLTCEDAHCCWAYFPLFYRGICGDCDIQECGVGFFSERCGHCATQEDCEAVEDCYWSDNFCRFGTGQCGEGLELQFCENQEDCEEKGGSWYDNYCWLEPKPIFINWEDYYDDYGDYEEPSAWINNLAVSVNKFYESVGGFLTAFERAFDIQGAYQKGLELGSVVPIARGYLATLNSFAGSLPFGEIFIFILTFMIVVGVFRMIRALVQLVKFW